LQSKPDDYEQNDLEKHPNILAMSRLLTNLRDNALKYTPETGLVAPLLLGSCVFLLANKFTMIQFLEKPSLKLKPMDERKYCALKRLAPNLDRSAVGFQEWTTNKH
jgi:hypothetical protein